MSNSIIALNEEWRGLRKDLKENRREFDDVWREQHKDHNCESKVFACNGEWFCEHLTKARDKHFKEKIERIDEIICCI